MTEDNIGLGKIFVDLYDLRRRKRHRHRERFFEHVLKTVRELGGEILAIGPSVAMVLESFGAPTALAATIEKLNEISRPYAERLMDEAISKAIKGKNIME